MNSDMATIQWCINDPPEPEKQQLLIVSSEGFDCLGNCEFVVFLPICNSIFLEKVPLNSYEFALFHHQIIFEKYQHFEVVVLKVPEMTENSITGLVVQLH